MRSLQGSLIIAGVFQVVIGFFGIWRVFIRSCYDSPLLSPPSPLPPSMSVSVFLLALVLSTDTVAVAAPPCVSGS